jgi:hypothetical protein
LVGIKAGTIKPVRPKRAVAPTTANLDSTVEIAPPMKQPMAKVAPIAKIIPKVEPLKPAPKKEVVPAPVAKLFLGDLTAPRERNPKKEFNHPTVNVDDLRKAISESLGHKPNAKFSDDYEYPEKEN